MESAIGFSDRDISIISPVATTLDNILAEIMRSIVLAKIATQ
jgi:hypothetical protein